MKHTEKESPGLHRYATCEWFYHPPRKPTDKSENAPPQLPPASQIPGLSDLAEPHNELMFESRRKWIRDTDSEYVKLSKQGGRPDLLKQRTPPPKKNSPVPYSRPDWFTDEWEKPPTDETQAPKWYLPDYMVYEEGSTDQGDSKYETRKGPYASDKKTVWQRDAEDNEKENQAVHQLKLPAINQKSRPEKGTTTQARVPPSTVAKEDHLGSKYSFPPMPFSKNNEPLNFSKLVSNGYADETDQQRKEWEKKVQRQLQTKEVTRGPPPLSEYQEKMGQKQLAKHTWSHRRKALSSKKGKTTVQPESKSDSQTKKPLFKLTKFQNVPARINTHKEPVKASAS